MRLSAFILRPGCFLIGITATGIADALTISCSSPLFLLTARMTHQYPATFLRITDTCVFVLTWIFCLYIIVFVLSTNIFVDERHAYTRFLDRSHRLAGHGGRAGPFNPKEDQRGSR